MAPNAALEIVGAPASRDVALLQLSRPRYDRARGTLSFVAKPLRSNADPALRSLERRADRGVSGSFGRASLFIDNGEEGNLLTVAFKGVPSGQSFEIALYGNSAQEQFFFSPAAAYRSESAGISWGTTATLLSMSCGSATCAGSVTIAVRSSAGEALELGEYAAPTEGTITASWAGGPVTTLPRLGGQGVELPPAPR